MEFYQMSDEKNFNMQKEGPQKIELLYSRFYDHLENADSDQVSSDLDDLEAFHETFQANRYDIYYRYQRENDQIKMNPRVAEIPTVYLVSSIRTQHLPQRKDWGNDSQEETKVQQVGYHEDSEEIEGKVLQQFSDEVNGINSKNTPCHILRHRNKQASLLQNCSNQNIGSKQNKTRIYKMQERPWKTDYITIKVEGYQQKQNKKKKLMHEHKRLKPHKNRHNRVIKKAPNENDVNELKNNQFFKIQFIQYRIQNALGKKNGLRYHPNDERSQKSLWDHISRDGSIINRIQYMYKHKDLQAASGMRLQNIHNLPPYRHKHEPPAFKTHQIQNNPYIKIPHQSQKSHSDHNHPFAPSRSPKKRPRHPYNSEDPQKISTQGEKQKNKYNSLDQINPTPEPEYQIGVEQYKL